MPTNSTPAAKVLLGCAKCGATLPDEAQFCLKCGKPISLPPKSPAVVEEPPPEIRQPRRTRPMIVGILLAILAGLMLWAGMSDSPTAQAVQEFVGWKHDRIILDAPFSVGPHTFRYYKFALPEGSVNVAVVGQFTSAADRSNAGNRRDTAKAKKEDVDNNIEVFVLTDSAFTVWQNGYATSALYESGKVAEGNVQADVPAGAGIYYLVFSNKSAPKTPKAVHATVLLRYKSWLPEWFRVMKGRVLDWIGFN
ncbi:MAG: zinc-ribbon domain-containing protein [Terriglobales bacterium]